jgi:hypothetical protein
MGGFMIAIIFGALVAALIQGTVAHPDCKERNFEPKACQVSEMLEKAK